MGQKRLHPLLLLYCIHKRVCWLLSKNLLSFIVLKHFPKHNGTCLIIYIFLATSEDKVKAIQEKLDLDDKLSSGERNKKEKR